MLSLEQQVCSLEYARKLKELGVKQESIFCWSMPLVTRKAPTIYYAGRQHILKDTDYYNYYSAFTSAELLEMLPDYDNKNDPKRIFFGIEYKEMREEMGGKYYFISDFVDYPTDNDFYSDNSANCLAMGIIHLIENKIIEVETINNE